MGFIFFFFFFSTPIVPDGPVHIKTCALIFCRTEDIHHQGNCGHRRRQQEQLSGTFCHHHQREEPASAVGKGELHRGHTRKHRPRHSCCGTYGWGGSGGRHCSLLWKTNLNLNEHCFQFFFFFFGEKI